MSTVLRSFTQWFDEKSVKIDAVIFDIDGVLLTNGAASGAMPLLSTLIQKRIPYCLLTNDGNHSPFEKAGYLHKAGIEVDAGDIVSCGHGLTLIARNQNLQGKLFFIMGDLGTPCYAESAGLATTRDLRDLSVCAGVIVGEQHYDWESTLNAVINFFIDHPRARLICPNPDLYFPGKGAQRIRLAAGSVARLITRTLAAYGLGITPLYLGKPHPPIFAYTHTLLEKRAGRRLAAEKVLMVGDNLDSDIAGAQKSGYLSALMHTGITTRDMLAKSVRSPDFVFEHL